LIKGAGVFWEVYSRLHGHAIARAVCDRRRGFDLR